jgi:excisionase family DNA binding protein
MAGQIPAQSTLPPQSGAARPCSETAPMAPEQGASVAFVTPSIPFESRLFSKRELADYFQVELRTIENWMARRYLPFIKIGGTIRFKVYDVLRHMETHHQVKPRMSPASLRRARHPVARRKA